MIHSCYAAVYSTLLRVRHRANIAYPFDPITQLTNYFPEIKLIKYSSLDPVDLATAKKTHPYGFSIIGVTTGSMQIYYNDLNQCLKRQRFTIAHELGHCVLNHDGISDRLIDSNDYSFADSIKPQVLITAISPSGRLLSCTQ